MLNKWITYGSIVAVSGVAGVFIGGGTDAVKSALQGDDRPQPRSATSVPVEASTTTFLSDPNTTALATAPAEEPTTTAAATTTTVAPATTTSTTTTTTTTPEATTSIPTTSVPPVTERSRLGIAVANGSRLQGEAGRAAEVLAPIGYAEITTLNAEPIDMTTVFFAEGRESEARRLADDSGIDDVGIAPLVEAPELSADSAFELVLVLGTDLNPEIN